MKILLVDDDAFFAQIISEFLGDNGIEVVTVSTTQEALEVDVSEYQAAIVDVMLPNNPELSGIEAGESRGGYLAGVALARRLRAKTAGLPLVLISAGVGGGEAREWARKNQVPFVFKYEDRGRLLSALTKLGLATNVDHPISFLVHGHDESLLAEVKDYLQNTLKWPAPIVLRDQPNGGKTIIEKFEEYAGNIDWVFVLLSPDDRTFDPKTNDEKRRARQNVIFELGFFYGVLGRLEGRVIVLQKGDVEVPSDIHGLVWIDVSAGVKASGEAIRREVGG